jgi:hypothetical protein
MKDNRFTITSVPSMLAAVAILSALSVAPALTGAADGNAAAVRFTDVTASAGIHFTHNAGRTGKKWLPETMGSGVAFFDAYGDGRLAILLLNGKDWLARGRHTTASFYRNNGNGTFTDATRGSGLDIEIHAMGVAVGDFDNDGRDDLYITALDGDHLFHNEGGGHFRDVTKDSGCSGRPRATSGVRWTAPRSLTARRSPTKVRP